uniref:Putative lytic transglycosylase n=1 Tax=viral metagenome TaxID=1070528 RepID=A0A6M3L7P8_9ZZZZ
MKVIFALLLTFIMCASAWAEQIGTASWYSVESCKREGTWQKYGGKMANGEVFDDRFYTCASWDYVFGTELLITNVRNNKSCVVRVTDRGPAKRLYRLGRIIDLSKGAFAAIAPLKQGIATVSIRRVK